MKITSLFALQQVQGVENSIIITIGENVPIFQEQPKELSGFSTILLLFLKNSFSDIAHMYLFTLHLKDTKAIFS